LIFADQLDLVITDESGVSLEAVTRTRGWAPIGQRTPRVPRERSTHQFNIIPAISVSGLVAHVVLERTVKRSDFEYFLEHILVSASLISIFLLFEESS
jgi:hypothetical protein